MTIRASIERVLRGTAATCQEVAVELGRDEHNVAAHLWGLQRRGIVRRERYVIVEDRRGYRVRSPVWVLCRGSLRNSEAPR